MADDVDNLEDKVELSAEAQALAEKGRSGTIDLPDPLAPVLIPAPAGVPEKFWDKVKGELRQDDLLKSYAELEKKFSTGGDNGDPAANAADPNADPADPDAGDPNADPVDPDAGDPNADPQDGDGDPADTPALAAAIEGAQAAYAETGELSDEVRAPLRANGITDDQIDLYLQGVKATESALEQAITKPFGSREGYDEAVAWAAAGGFSAKQAEAFNAMTGDVETAKQAGQMLFDAYKVANPGEGRLLNPINGAIHGEVYTSLADFNKDLAAADAIRDQEARRKAINKLRRSRKAKSIKR